jgi:hypothetical protein
MAYRLTSAQRCMLSDCVRGALMGWLLSDPDVGPAARRIEHMATTIVGFSFSRFVDMAVAEIGGDYRPRSFVSNARFPLTVHETAALAAGIEMHMSSEDQIVAAGMIACHSPYGQPSVGTRDWRTYIAALAALGLSISDERPGWREEVRERLHAFRRAVAAAAVADLVAAE